MQPHQTGLKVRCRSAVASAPCLFCPESLRGCITLMLAGRKLARRAEARRAKAGAHGRGRTCTGDALDVVPLLVGLHERKKWVSGAMEWWIDGKADGSPIIQYSNHPTTHSDLVSPAGLTSQVLRVRCPNETVRYRELKSHQLADFWDSPALCLSYEDKTSMTQMVRASRNAPQPGTDPVRCGV